MVVGVAFFLFAIDGPIQVLGPIVARDVYDGARTWGFTSAAMGIGQIAGGLLSLRWRPRRPMLVISAGMSLAAVPVALLALEAPVWTLYLSLGVMGVQWGLYDTFWTTCMQREVEPAMISRVSSYDYLGSPRVLPGRAGAGGPARGRCSASPPCCGPAPGWRSWSACSSSPGATCVRRGRWDLGRRRPRRPPRIARRPAVAVETLDSRRPACDAKSVLSVALAAALLPEASLEEISHIGAIETVRVLANEERLRLLRLLMRGPATLTQLGAVVGHHPAWVRHHVLSLEQAGLVELVETRPTKGYVEKFYCATARAYAVDFMVLPEEGERGLLVILGSDDLALDMLARRLREDDDRPRGDHDGDGQPRGPHRPAARRRSRRRAATSSTPRPTTSTAPTRGPCSPAARSCS